VRDIKRYGKREAVIREGEEKEKNIERDILRERNIKRETGGERGGERKERH
jgi:hypothetical protein